MFRGAIPAVCPIPTLLESQSTVKPEALTAMVSANSAQRTVNPIPYYQAAPASKSNLVNSFPASSTSFFAFMRM